MSEVPSAASLDSKGLATMGAHDSHEQVQMQVADHEDPATARESPAAPEETSRLLASTQVPKPEANPAVTVATSSLSLQKHHHVVDIDHDKNLQPCVTALAPDAPGNTATIVSTIVNEGKEQDPIINPPSPIVPPPPAPRDTLSQTPHLPAPVARAEIDPPKHHHLNFPHLPHILSSHKSHDGAADLNDDTHEKKMLFGHHATPSVAQRRRNYATTNALTDYEADLTSKDRAKQKEAVKKFLGERVRQDWTFEWPRPEPTSAVEEQPQEPQSPTSILSPTFSESITPEDDWKERDEWLSNGSESENDSKPIPATASSPDTPSTGHSPYRFESPDGVGDTIKKTQCERKRRRKKRLADEMAWNVGLACFTARRDAWTGARRVPKSGLQSSAARVPLRGSLSTEGSSTAIEPDEDEEWEDDIEIPIAPPIIPPENAMRASILPGAYNTIYDKVVVQQLTPSCPMNLRDVTRSCVQGWKRDGEWPPKATPAENKKKGRKMSVASLFGRSDKEKSEKGREKEVEDGEKRGVVRRSLQKILSLTHKDAPKEAQHVGANGGNEAAAGN